MFARLTLNLTLVVGVLASYGVIASELNGERYCLGGDATAAALPAGAQHLFCSSLDVHTPDLPTLHWGALLPGGG